MGYPGMIFRRIVFFRPLMSSLWLQSIDAEVQMIERSSDVRSIVWMPNGKSILTVEGPQITQIVRESNSPLYEN